LAKTVQKLFLWAQYSSVIPPKESPLYPKKRRSLGKIRPERTRKALMKAEGIEARLKKKRRLKASGGPRGGGGGRGEGKCVCGARGAQKNGGA